MKRTRGRFDRNVAPCSRSTTNVIGPLHECKSVHAQKPYSCQTYAHESAKSEEEDKERKKDRKDRGQEAYGKKDSPTKQKAIEGTKTRPTISTTKVNKAGKKQ